MTTIGTDFAIANDEDKPRVVWVLTREEYERLRPCTPSRTNKGDWWADSPRLERTTDGRELLVYREGWEAEMARSDPGALVWLGKKRLGGLDETAARALVALAREAKKAAAEPDTTVIE